MQYLEYIYNKILFKLNWASAFYLIILATVVDILIRTLFVTDDKIQTQTNSTTIRKLIVLHN